MLFKMSPSHVRDQWSGMGSHEARKTVSSKVDPLRSPMRADLADSIDGAIDGSVRIGRA